MTRREFFHKDGKIETEPFHYTACGLDEIYLCGGFKRKETPYGAGVTISNMDGLHKAIGLSLVMDRKTLLPKELRFLRKEMDITQAELGGMLRLSGQQVARWEKGESEISGPAEVLIRVFFVMTLLPSHKRAQFVNLLTKKMETLNKNDETRTAKLLFRESEKGWIRTMANNDCAMATA